MRIPLATKTDELQGTDEMVESLDTQENLENLETADQECSQPEPGPEPEAGSARDLPLDQVSLLRVGIDEMSTMSQVKDFPEFFLRLARRTGLRLVLLKRWTSGLQVFMEENASLPAEAKQKLSRIQMSSGSASGPPRGFRS